MDDTLCDVVPNRLLLEGLSFHSEEYVYRHSNDSVDPTKVPQESAFYCTITGHETVTIISLRYLLHMLQAVS